MVQVLQQAWFQRCLIVLFTVAVFWHALWGGAPRADQLAFLHQVSQYGTLTEALPLAPSWNRTHSVPGDASQFRPILYIVLTLEYFAFGYNFFLWQIFAIGLHVLVALSLFSILLKTRLYGTLWPLALTCLFSGAFPASELVIWNRLTGYVLFCLLIAQATSALLTFLATGEVVAFVVSFICSALATFTYEFGAVFTLLAGLALLSHYREAEREQESKAYLLLLATGAMLFLPFVYALVTARPPGTHEYTSARISQGIADTGLQLLAWALEVLLPATFRVAASSRAVITDFVRSRSTLSLVNYAAAALACIGLISLLVSARTRIVRKALVRAVPAVVFLGLYSGVIAFGQSTTEGIDFTLLSSLYDAYIPTFATCIGIGFASGRLGDRGILTTVKVHNPNALFYLGCGLALLVGLNGWNTFQLCRAYRLGYSSSRLELISRIVEWQKSDGRSQGAFFRINSACADDLEWFEPYVRRGANWTGPFRMPDVLFPEKSIALNPQGPNAEIVSVTDISCPALDLRDFTVIEGRWEVGPNSPYRQVKIVDGRTSFENEGNVAIGRLDQGYIVLESWNLTGRVIMSADSQTIRWNNGKTWFRPWPLSGKDARLHSTAADSPSAP